MVFILIGMPGCGKSCMGKAVSKKIGLKHLDADKVIEKRTGRTLSDIIFNDGVDAFKKIEEETLLSLKLDNVILSTGGSAIYYPAAMEHLKSIGCVVYLYCPYGVIEERLGDFSKRGVLIKNGSTFADLYAERMPLYQKYADVTVKLDESDLLENAKKIMLALDISE